MPICPPLAYPVPVSDAEAFVAPLAVDRPRAEEVAKKAILESFLRPEDIPGNSGAP